MAASMTGRAEIVILDPVCGTVVREPLPRQAYFAPLWGRALAMALLERFRAAGQTVVVLATSPLAGYGVPLIGTASLVYQDSDGVVRSDRLHGSVAASLFSCGIAALVLPVGAHGEPVLTIHADGSLTRASVPHVSGLYLKVGTAALEGVRGACLIDHNGNLQGSEAGLALVACGIHQIVFPAPPAAQQVTAEPAIADLWRLINASPLLSGPCGVATFGRSAIAGLCQAEGITPSYRLFEAPSAYPQFQAVVQRAGCHGCAVACWGLDEQSKPQASWRELAGFVGLAGITDQELLTGVLQKGRACGMDPSMLATLLVAAPGTPHEHGQALVDESLSLPVLQAQGTYRAWSLQGVPLTPLEPRAAVGQTLARLVSPQPGAWTTAFMLAGELFRKPLALDRFDLTGRARLVARLEDVMAVFDGLGACLLSSVATDVEEWAAVLSAVSSQTWCAADLVQAGQASIATERRLNQRFLKVVDPRSLLPACFFVERSPYGFAPLHAQMLRDEWERYETIRQSQDAPQTVVWERGGSL